jgi:hypothetical protein
MNLIAPSNYFAHVAARHFVTCEKALSGGLIPHPRDRYRDLDDVGVFLFVRQRLFGIGVTHITAQSV